MRNLPKWIKQTRTNVKFIFNIPDYDKYLLHHQEHHPDTKPMTEKEFYMSTLNDRYNSGKINRCC
ncbi:YbdD/YjiX family protein [Paenibacillus sp. N1-5-1-14]|uniref:YbdD/YjiX family protein n=1 Tax=Paenibacillus radicibacter TaxID=2972488 RepID=UPI002158A678|nr:YbdD/YjiX family protein [Paenibacillus radicibacter]MCR8641061.1 YbdD/YjiX family protein [Paenibacillus radicibacter]